jgi:ATP-dependent Zn protease
MYRMQHSSIIDTATIERRGDVGGFVSPIPIEDRFVEWRSEVEIDVMTFLASLAGERMFYDGDHTQGVGGDMAAATGIVTRSFLSHAMGPTLRAFNGSMLGQSGLITGGMALVEGVPFEGVTAQAVEDKLQELYARTMTVLEANRREVLAVTHALETFKTLSGEDVVAVIRGTEGPLVDGRGYLDPAFIADLESYHALAVEAHKVVHERPPGLPTMPEPMAAFRATQPL